MNNKLLLWITVLFFIVPIAMAVKPSPQLGGAIFTEGYSIEYPKYSTIPLNTTLDLDFHVFNISNGLPVNQGISCDLHLYNGTTGHSVYYYTVTNPIYQYDYEFIVDAGNFSLVGDYSYVIQCNNSVLGGYNSIGFSVTTTGKELMPEQASMLSSVIIALIIALIGIAIVILKIAEHFKGEDQRWYGMLFRTVLYVFAIGFCMLAIGAINQMFGIITIISSLSAITSSVNLISKLMLFVIIAVGIFAIVYLIERFLLKIKMNKDKEEEEWNK